jgi:hypothetical protein
MKLENKWRGNSMSENPFGEFLQVTHRQTLEFFYRGLREVVESEVKKEDFLYPASVLSHFAQVSCKSSGEVPTPANLSFVYDNFINPGSQSSVTIFRDPGLSETAAAQCLLLTGFFQRQMQGRHSIDWYTQLGRRFFHISSQLTVDKEKEVKMTKMSEQFEMWRDAYYKLNRHLRERQYIIKTPSME